jgi:bifunctional DNase/RNase
METAETLKAIVMNGSNLVLARPVTHDLLIELAELAVQSGATLTISTAMKSEFAAALASRYGRSITFVHGFADLKKN